MSGIAKPHFFFSTALPVVVRDSVFECENIQSAEKFDLPANGTGNPAKSQILLIFKKGPVKDQFISFADATARNTAYTALKTLLAASV